MTDVATLSTEDNETMQAFTKVSEFVSKARDAIISASTLAKEVGELRSQFEALKAEMEEAHRKNADFEQQLAFVRSERDAALRDSEHHQANSVTLEAEVVTVKRELETLQGQHLTLSTEHQETSESYRLAQIEVNALKAEVDRLNSDRARVESELESIQRILRPQPRNEYGQFDTPAVATG